MVKFTEADIRTGTSSQSLERGASYYRSGSVSDLVQRGSVLTARVEGSGYSPYRIKVTLLDTGKVSEADCTCSYDWGGYCKHIVAVLLAALHDGEAITVKPELEMLLAGLTDTQLRRVILAVAGDQPELVAAIEQEVEWLTTPPTSDASGAAPAGETIVVDISAMRREMRKDLRRVESEMGGGGDYYDRYDHWEDEGNLFDPFEVLSPQTQLVEELLAGGKAVAATEVIVAIIEEWGAGIGDLDELITDGNEDVLSEAADDLGALLAEALLSQDLSEEQRNWWSNRIADWEQDLFELGCAATAIEQWWDYPPLVAAMGGDINERGAWEGERPFYADELALVRLRILERQGRIEEYINLAEAEGQFGLYLNMLARSGQVERAVADAQRQGASSSESLSLAQVLVEKGEQAAALAVAAHGLDVNERANKRELAQWTLALAQHIGDSDLALHAAQVAFFNSLSLSDYQVVEALAGAQWPKIKTSLLERTGQSAYDGTIDIYLYENMLVEAMAAIDRWSFSPQLERVIQATRDGYPDWGIAKYKLLAENIMDASKSKDYDVAVAKLRTARDIYLQHDRGAEWQTYLAALLDLHARKYKLVPMLRAIR